MMLRATSAALTLALYLSLGSAPAEAVFRLSLTTVTIHRSVQVTYLRFNEF
jgi:hypothetical protein